MGWAVGPAATNYVLSLMILTAVEMANPSFIIQYVTFPTFDLPIQAALGCIRHLLIPKYLSLLPTQTFYP
jgi:hypothetical protein